MEKVPVFEVTRTRMVVEVFTVEALTVREAEAKARRAENGQWRLREQEVLTVSTCQVKP